MLEILKSEILNRDKHLNIKIVLTIEIIQCVFRKKETKKLHFNIE